MKTPWSLLPPVLLLSMAAQAAEFPSLRWLHPGADPVQHLAAVPAECLDLNAPADTLILIETGRQLFRNPLLLGGQDARAGMSCQSCHRNGHGHPGFHMEGSGEGLPLQPRKA